MIQQLSLLPKKPHGFEEIAPGKIGIQRMQILGICQLKNRGSSLLVGANSRTPISSSFIYSRRSSASTRRFNCIISSSGSEGVR